MIWLVLTRLAGLLAVVLLAAIVVFYLLSLAPGGASDGRDLLTWLGHALVGDFGNAGGPPAGRAIAAALAVTVPLALLAMAVAALAGLGLGYIAGMRAGSVLDRVVDTLGELAVATPNFWLGMVLALVFAGTPHWLPAAGFVPWQENAGEAFVSLFLPALALAIPPAGALALAARTAFAPIRESTAVLLAEARGLTAAEAIRRHGLKPALLRLAGPASAQAATVVVGTVVVENVFYLPGLGRLILGAVAAGDMVMLRASLAVLVALATVTPFLIWFGFASADPRLRTARQ